MAATDGQIILAASRFGDTLPVYIRDFAQQKLPAIAKIVKGQHHNLGVPTLSAPSLQSIALFLSAGKKYQILAQPIKIKEGRKPVNVGPKVLIPETYSGYFELLSEDGRSTRCIDSVLELSKRRNLRVLVRESFRCTPVNRTIHAGEMLTTINDNGKYLQCKNNKDEIINLSLETKAKFSPIAKEDSISGVHTVRNLLLKRMPVIVRLVYGNIPKGIKQPFLPELRLLGCVEIDRIFALPLQKDNDLVPVPLTAKIKLQRAINMDKLEHLIEYSRFLEKAQRYVTEARDRLQIVDLKLNDKVKKDSKFSSRNKLQSGIDCYNVASLMENGYVLRKCASCDSHNKNQTSAVMSRSEIPEEYNEIDHIYDYVRGLTPLSKGLSRFEPINESQTIKSYHTDSSGNYCSLIRAEPNSTGITINNSGCSNGISNTNYSSLESFKANNSNVQHTSLLQFPHLHQHQLHQTLAQSLSHNQVYTSHQSPTVLGTVNHYHHGNVEDNIKPVPPPIETIPSKKLPEKRQRPTLPKLHLKNTHSANSNSSTNGNSSASGNNHQRNSPTYRHNGSKSLVTPIVSGATHTNNHYQGVAASKILTPNNGNISTSLSAAVLYKDSGLEPQSPLFHIRYKSLSNLQLTPERPAITPLISTNSKGQTQLSTDLMLKNNFNNHTHCVLPLPLNKSLSGNILSNGSGALNHSNTREGTLDSSRSGGRTSGDSNKLPEKKTRRLSRPRSLSNLVWDLRPSKEKSKKKLYIHHLDHRQQPTLYL